MDIKKLIGEATEYDKKQALENRKPKSWCKSISAFANTLGGSLIFGISNDDKIVGLENAERDAEVISEQIKTRLSPIPTFNLRFLTVDDKTLIVLDVYAGRDATGKSFEDKNYESFGIVGFDGILTNAGALLADESPIRHSRVFCTRWNGLNKSGGLIDALDSAEYSGSIITLLNESTAFIKRNMRTMWRKLSTTRENLPDYTERGFFEALVNALIHRDYLEVGSEVHVDMFDDRMVIYSPGGMIDGSFIQNLNLYQVPSKRRNPVLADIFARLDYMERQGSGLSKIRESYASAANYSEDKLPVFYSDRMQFMVTFPNLNYEFTYSINDAIAQQDDFTQAAVHETIQNMLQGKDVEQYIVQNGETVQSTVQDAVQVEVQERENDKDTVQVAVQDRENDKDMVQVAVQDRENDKDMVQDAVQVEVQEKENDKETVQVAVQDRENDKDMVQDAVQVAVQDRENDKDMVQDTVQVEVQEKENDKETVQDAAQDRENDKDALQVEVQEKENDKETVQVTVQDSETDKQTEQDPAQVIGQVTENELLDFCKIPRSRRQMQEFSGLSGRNNFSRKYIKPLLEQGKLKMSIPEKPNSKNQKYYSQMHESGAVI